MGGVASTALASDPTATAQTNSAVVEDSKKGGISIAPVVGYDPTFKFVFGGAFFYETEGLSLGTDFNLNFKEVYQLHINLSHRFSDDWEYQFHSGITKGFDPYYGEGGETRPEDFTHLWGIKNSSKLKLVYHTSKIFALGVFTDLRIRTEEAHKGETFARRAPDETSGAVGMSAEVDTRDSVRNPQNGFRFTVDATYMPSKFSTLATLKDSGQIEGSFIVYKEILDDVIPETIAAFRVMGGYSLGEPSYMYRYALGGANQMNGYGDNRFRGKQYYLQQTELRFPIWKLFSGATSLGFGDATDTKFTNPKLCYGIGLRIGLPPDWVSKIRIDVGFGRDGSGIFANFGQTF